MLADVESLGKLLNVARDFDILKNGFIYDLDSGHFKTYKNRII